MNNNYVMSHDERRLAALKRGRATKRKRKLASFTFSLFRFILLFGLCFIILYPIIQQLLIAFREPADINDPSVIWIPKRWSVMNFKIASLVLSYPQALLDTFIVSSLSMLLQLISTGLAGYAFARLKFKGSNILFIFVIITIIIPPQALTLSQYLYFRDMKLIGHIGSILLMNGLGMGIRSGIFIFIFKTFFQGLPKELEESAQIDGANVFRIFWNIMLPNARGAIITVALFAFVWQWNDSYFVNLFEVSNANFPLLTVELMNAGENIYQALFYTGALNLIGQDIWSNPLFLSAITNVCALLIMLPLLIMYLIVQKQFVESIERTGIVG